MTDIGGERFRRIVELIARLRALLIVLAALLAVLAAVVIAVRTPWPDLLVWLIRLSLQAGLFLT